MSKIKTYVTRGDIVESIHHSKCIIKDYNFKTIFTTGNESNLVYPRSAIKIFQAVHFIKSGAHKNFKLTKKQLAMSCSSHTGELEHLKVLEKWVQKINFSKKKIKCGVHNPLNLKSSNNLLMLGKKPNQLHNNCSGKHLAMISGCKMYKMNTEKYVNFYHPYQKLIRNVLEYFTESKILKKQIGIDGCSAPQYAFSLESLSISMINLLKELKNERKYTQEIKLLLKAIAEYPHLTGGNSIYSCQLMKVTNGKMFSKNGAEGVLLFAHKEKKIGGIIKVEDGNERALPSAANEIFKKLNILKKSELKKLSFWTKEKINNHARINVGHIYTNIM